MFEQSVFATPTTRKGLGFLASLSVQVLVIAMTVLLPLIHSSRLTLFKLSSPLNVALTPPPPKTKPAAPEHAVPIRTPSPSKVFVPTSVPSRTPAMVGDQMVAEPPSLDHPGVPGGTGPALGVNALNTLWRNPDSPPPVRAEATPVTTADKPIRVSIGVQEAKLMHKLIPLYPTLARQARISGVVHLMGTIGKDGAIRNLQVVGGHPLLVQAAVDAVRQWIYQPTLLNGQPVEVICPIDVNFNLN